MELRRLEPGDEALAETFLAAHAATSMFLRSNLRVAGLLDRGEPHQGTYVAALEDDRAVAVASHAWNGNLLLQAPVHLEAVAAETVRRSRRRVAGLLGPWPQVVAARRALGLAGARTSVESCEVLYALALDRLVVPPPLARGEVTCRPPAPEEMELVAEWRARFYIESLGAADGPALRVNSTIEVERTQREGAHWVLDAGGGPIAYTAFNARLPDCVQVGGVYTPPELRRRGHARAAVAGSLVAARAEGASEALLFTDERNRPARAAYEALGFREVGHYGLVLFGPQARDTPRTDR